MVMHNGIEVLRHGYYGKGMSNLLRHNLGVHEPQEERVFQSVLPLLPPGAVMLELGAYWSFYSMWFLQIVPEGRVYLVEPDPVRLEVGHVNFAHNEIRGTFLQGYVGGTAGTGEDGIPIFTIDELLKHFELSHIDLLHIDIQGGEAELLAGSPVWLRSHKVGYLFVSTHSGNIHYGCLEALEHCGYRVVAEVDPQGSYSVDGVIVAHAPLCPASPPISLSRRPNDSAGLG